LRVHLKCPRDAVNPVFLVELDMVTCPREEEVVRVDDELFQCVMVEHVVSIAGGAQVHVLLTRTS
jgi:hypothetical protein